MDLREPCVLKYDIEWTYAESPYYAWEYESFHDVEELLQNCPSMSDMSEEEWEKELDIRIDIMEKVMSNWMKKVFFLRTKEEIIWLF